MRINRFGSNNRNIRNRLGITNGTSRGGFNNFRSGDLRNKISRNNLSDARTLINRPILKRNNRGDARSLIQGPLTTKKRPNIPFSIPKVTVKNEYFGNGSLLHNKRPADELPFNFLNQGSFTTNSNNNNGMGRSYNSGSSKISSIQGFRVEVRGLLPSVVLEDVHELFNCIGKLKSCKMIRPGAAEVIYCNYKDAEESVNRYNNRELDGKPMKVQITTRVDPSDVAMMAQSSSDSMKTMHKSRMNEVNEIDMEIVHKALFNVSARDGPRRPVDFNVNIN